MNLEASFPVHSIICFLQVNEDTKERLLFQVEGNQEVAYIFAQARPRSLDAHNLTLSHLIVKVIRPGLESDRTGT